jgi:hypothetical protein
VFHYKLRYAKFYVSWRIRRIRQEFFAYSPYAHRFLPRIHTCIDLFRVLSIFAKMIFAYSPCTPNFDAMANPQSTVRVHAVYLEYQNVCPLGRIGTTPPTPALPQASVSPRRTKRRGHTRLLRVSGWRVPIRLTGEKV